VQCSVCKHHWYQAKDKLYELKAGFEMTDFPEAELARIKSNIEAKRNPMFKGESKLYVGNLSYRATEDELRDLFASKTGEVVGEAVVVKGDDGRSRGFAFITMLTKEGGEAALELDGTDYDGRDMQVSKPKENDRR